MDFSKAFKANDVRGIYGKTITDEMFYRIGYACYKFFKSKIVVGTDMRVSSPLLEKAFISGYTDAGGSVLDIGLVGTDVVYYASGKFKLPAVMITASHNPSKYNGIKFVSSGAKPINKKNGLKTIQKLAEKVKKRKVKMKGTVLKRNIIKQYVKHTHSFVSKKKLRKIKVVVDAGNGMAGRMVPYVYSKLPLSIIPMYFKLDGRFPHHVPNPVKPSNTRDLQRRVKKEKADYGVEFDADTDRVYFIDECGRRVNSSIIAGLIIKHLFLKTPGVVVYSSSCSKIVPELALFYGGRVFESRVGHTFVKKKMAEKNGTFGVEHSGHFYFKNNFNADSGMIASLLVYEIYSMQPYPFSAMVAEFSKYPKSEEISVRVKDVDKAMKRMKALIQQ